MFATGTLAFGVNMPCKSTVFFSKSKYLTPLMFHQMRGRSGRRGYDNIGHCVFFKITSLTALRVFNKQTNKQTNKQSTNERMNKQSNQISLFKNKLFEY
jgi:superfamily II RNA helicase